MASFENNLSPDFGDEILWVAGVLLRPPGDIGGEFSRAGGVSRVLFGKLVIGLSSGDLLRS